MEIEILFLLIGLTAVSSLLVSMIGLGGGVLFIPILVLIFHLPVNMAVGTSIFCMTLNTFSATIGFWSEKKVNWKLGLAYDIFDIPGIVLGAWLTDIIPALFLEIFCGINICFIAILVLKKKSSKNYKQLLQELKEKSIQDANQIDCRYAWSGKNLKWVVFSSFFGGLITGMVGLGGGTVDTTSMILLGVNPQVAAGSSSWGMLLTNIVGLCSHIILGNVSWEYAIPMGITAFFSAFLGSRLAVKLNENKLRKSLGIVALFTGIRLLFPVG